MELQSAQDTSSQSRKSDGSNASIGVGFGLFGSQNGFSLELAASTNMARGDGDSVTNHNTHVTASDTLTVASGRDTNLRGAQLTGDQIVADVGHQSEYDFAKKNAKVVAQKLGISEQEAEGRIVAEILRNSDKETAEASSGKHDYEVRSVVGCQNLNCGGSKNDPNYGNHDYNSQYISANQAAYDRGQKNISTGLTEAGVRDKNIVYERIGKGALAAAACVASGGAACKAAATGVGAAGAISYVTGSALSTSEVIGSAWGGAIGASYGANLSAWAGGVETWFEKSVLGVTKAAPIFAGKEIWVPIGNSTNLGGSFDPLVDPSINPWWGLNNTINKLKEDNK